MAALERPSAMSDEHLALAGVEHGERVGPPGGAEELGDHFGVQRRASDGDALERLDEVADVGHPVLEQVADAGGVVGQQLGGVAGLDVLREEQDAEALVAGAAARAPTRSPSSVKVGGIRMSTTATSGGFCGDRAAQGVGVGDGAGDDEAAVDQQLDEAVAQDGRVLGDDDPQGLERSRRAAAGRR